MSEPNMDPGPLPAVVEPELPGEQTMVVSTVLGWQVGVTADWLGTGLVGLTLRVPGYELTTPLTPGQVDQLRQLLLAGGAR
jgi:hypothetical protein